MRARPRLCIRTNLEVGAQIAARAQRILRARECRNDSPAPFRSTGIRTPPSRNLSLLARVVQKQNVPWLPFKSGTHMPESSTPGNFSGGKVTGTRMTEQKTPALPSQCQNGVPLRSPLTSDLPSGSEYLPIFR